MLTYKSLQHFEHMPDACAELVVGGEFHRSFANALLLTADAETPLKDYEALATRREIATTIGRIVTISEMYEFEPPLLEREKTQTPATTLSGRALAYCADDNEPLVSLVSALLHEYIVTGRFDDGTPVNDEALDLVVEKLSSLDANTSVPFHLGVEEDSRIKLLTNGLWNASADSILLESIVRVKDVDMGLISGYVMNGTSLPDDLLEHLEAIRYNRDVLEALSAEIAAVRDPGQMTRFNLIARNANFPEITKKIAAPAVASEIQVKKSRRSGKTKGY